VKLQGRLDEEDIADVVQRLGAGRFTGRLRLERPDVRLTLSVDEGRLAFALSSDADDRLGPRLLRRGAITLRQMQDATRSLRPGKRFGTVLVEMGFLAPKELVCGVVDQTRDIILHAFRWTSGEYRGEEGRASGEEITLNMSTPQLLLDGISQLDSWTRIEKGCGPLGTRYARAVGADALLKQLTLDVDQAELLRAAEALRAIDGARDVEALCAGSALNHFEVCRNLWAFRVIGLARRLESAVPLDEDGLEFVLPQGDT
jgi:hypothetical protein